MCVRWIVCYLLRLLTLDGDDKQAEASRQGRMLRMVQATNRSSEEAVHRRF
jgi:hypothetical protein